MTEEDHGDMLEHHAPAETWDYRGFTADGWCGAAAALSEAERAVLQTTPGFQPLWESDRASETAFSHFSLLCPLVPGHEGFHGTYVGARRWSSRDFWSPRGLDAFDTSAWDWYLIWRNENGPRVFGPTARCSGRKEATTDDLQAVAQRYGALSSGGIDGEWWCSLWRDHADECKFHFVETLDYDFSEYEEPDEQATAVEESSENKYAYSLETADQELLSDYLSGDASEWELAERHYLVVDKVRELLAAQTTPAAREVALQRRLNRIHAQQVAMQNLLATQLKELGLEPLTLGDAILGEDPAEECARQGVGGDEKPEPSPHPPKSPPPEAVVMIQQRWQGWTLDTIGKNFGLSRERIRQILAKHGGPTAEQVRDRRAEIASAAERNCEAAVAADICGALDGRGPMTVAEMVAATGRDAEDVSRFWPRELSHLLLRAAGTYENRWSDEEVLDAIRDAALYEFPLTTNAYAELLSQGQIKGPSMPRIWQRFGSWTAACEAAGVVAGQPMRTNYQSRWTDDDLLQIVRRYLLDPNAPNSAHRFDEWKRAAAPEGPSFQTLRNRFGSWTEVKRRALAQEDGAT
ncbi:hypothetical protein KG112_10375 [Nocardioides sp. zg-ZUI104]|uniref:sigma factor-like helix-turn-helix DNA-binding protein n=1 Tax=Nocardioides faecalis TaxID=2803858 RepID=UPI001BCB441B|nr:sigma factor-like helix-turn-helix DNA-binding protein [Nocardioides faecalis]MBS4753207.1 hypothetical protein [Nocardioides faecalis]